MIDLTIRDLTKTEDEENAVDFISLTNSQWEEVKVFIEKLRGGENGVKSRI